jgi:hypothetical protein
VGLEVAAGIVDAGVDGCDSIRVSLGAAGLRRRNDGRRSSVNSRGGEGSSAVNREAEYWVARKTKVGASIGCKGRQTESASAELADATGMAPSLLYPCVEWTANSWTGKCVFSHTSR